MLNIPHADYKQQEHKHERGANDKKQHSTAVERGSGCCHFVYAIPRATRAFYTQSCEASFQSLETHIFRELSLIWLLPNGLHITRCQGARSGRLDAPLARPQPFSLILLSHWLRSLKHLPSERSH